MKAIPVTLPQRGAVGLSRVAGSGAVDFTDVAASEAVGFTGIAGSESVGLSRVPRPEGRDLNGPELQAFVEALAARPEEWIDLVKHDSHQRVYVELLSDPHLTAWLICWMDDHDTGFHDHDASVGAVAVVGGRVREERLRLDGPPRNRVFAAGESFHFSPADIHRVRHAGQRPGDDAARLLAAAAAHGRLRGGRGRGFAASSNGLHRGVAPAAGHCRGVSGARCRALPRCERRPLQSSAGV